MADKRRYLVGYGVGAVLPKEIEQLTGEFLSGHEQAEEVRRLRGGQRVVRMTEAEAAQLARLQTGLAVEEDLELELYSPMPGLPPRLPDDPPAHLTVKVVDAASQQPVGNVTIYCVGERLLYQGMTGRNGVARLEIPERAVQRVIASPSEGYWSKLIEAPVIEDNTHLVFALDELPAREESNWGYRQIGMEQLGERFTGQGVKVAVIDSGIAPHQKLEVSGGYNSLEDQDPDHWNYDRKGHGTHLAGIIAGMAPEAELYAVKVYPGGRVSDLVDAINWCIDNYMDVVSIALGTVQPSQQVQQALLDATQRGITCIAAAGNGGGAVCYPAAYDEAIGVSAVGNLASFPEDSAHALQLSECFGYDGEIFFANFSNRGPEIDVCAPGVAIPSTVPTGQASWDGTSMACAHTAGLAALVLEAYPEIRTGDAYQPGYLRQIITGTASDLGFAAEMQGAGLVNAAAALSSAYSDRAQEEESMGSYRDYLDGLLSRAKGARAAIEESLARLESL